ncbi:MAG: hypothetical protein NZ807_14620, partial [Dehalococcoidia bacterium]|nr:hypothetical protein [Dehalococcoidia bacterium]
EDESLKTRGISSPIGIGEFLNACPQGRAHTKVFGGMLKLLAESGFENFFPCRGFDAGPASFQALSAYVIPHPPRLRSSPRSPPFLRSSLVACLCGPMA